MKTTEFVRGKTQEILNYYGLPPVNPRMHFKGECPMCGGKDKLRIDDKNGSGSWICRCGSGNIWDLLMLTTGKQFKELAKEIDEAFGNTRDAEDFKPKPESVHAKHQRLSIQGFRSASKLAGTMGEQYLNARGISRLPAGGLKYSESEYNSDTNSSMPAMYALASDEFGEACYRHLTYLDGDKKADVVRQKKVLGLKEHISGSVAVKLFQVKSTLGIAEGIETALSAHQLYRMPVWSTLNASLMKRFKAPEGVDTLVIFADNDTTGTGLAAAFACARSNLLCNNAVKRVIVRWPELEDFNDMLTQGCQVYEWELKHERKTSSEETH